MPVNHIDRYHQPVYEQLLDERDPERVIARERQRQRERHERRRELELERSAGAIAR